jgi:hypothetical protein
LSPNLRTEGHFQALFFDVNRYSLLNSIDLRRVFVRYLDIVIRIFGDSVSRPGLYGGLYGQNLPYKFKNSYGDFRNRNFKKSHRTTGPRSDLRQGGTFFIIPSLSETGFVILGKFWSRFDLRQRRNWKFLSDDQGCLIEQTVPGYPGSVVYSHG